MSQQHSTTQEATGETHALSPEEQALLESRKHGSKNSGNLGETIKQAQERHQSSSSERREEQAEMQDVKDEEREKQELRNRRAELWRRANVPILHQKEPNYTEDQLAHIARIAKAFGTGAIWVILGEWGTGKTQIAVAVIHGACSRLRYSKFTTAIEFFIALRSPYQEGGSRDEQAVINDFVRPEVLVIDDAHVRGETDYENRMFHHVIDQRHKALKTTILTSNQSVEVFSDTIGGAIIDRMCAAGGIIECKGESFRGKEK